VEAKFQIFLILLAVLAGTALVARRINVAPAILLLLAGIVLAFVPGMPTVELPPELVLLVVLPPLVQYAAAYRFHHDRLWNTGSPAGACHRAARAPTRWRVMTVVGVSARHTFAISRRMAPEVLLEISLPS